MSEQLKANYSTFGPGAFFPRLREQGHSNIPTSHKKDFWTGGRSEPVCKFWKDILHTGSLRSPAPRPNLHECLKSFLLECWNDWFLDQPFHLPSNYPVVRNGSWSLGKKVPGSKRRTHDEPRRTTTEPFVFVVVQQSNIANEIGKTISVSRIDMK
jgi:hypothetical protein